MGKTPRKHECEEFLNTHSQIMKKSWKKVKDFVHNKSIHKK